MSRKNAVPPITELNEPSSRRDNVAFKVCAILGPIVALGAWLVQTSVTSPKTRIYDDSANSYRSFVQNHQALMLAQNHLFVLHRFRSRVPFNDWSQFQPTILSTESLLFSRFRFHLDLCLTILGP